MLKYVDISYLCDNILHKNVASNLNYATKLSEN